mgnify:CR=1 FL=1
MDNLEGESSEDSDDEFSEEDDDESSGNANEIIVPDIDNVLSIGQVPVPEISPTPTLPSSLSPTPSSSSQLQCNDHEIVENIIDIQANDASSEDLEPAPIKRARLDDKDGEVIF